MQQQKGEYTNYLIPDIVQSNDMINSWSQILINCLTFNSIKYYQSVS
jgi:hypothetical protein